MAAHARDDGFHEIQLNGKQLVFMFMAVTVVSVVIFLCGVLVGRGVRVDRTQAGQSHEPSAVDQLRDSLDPTKPPTVQQSEDPTKAPPPTPAEGGASAQESRTASAAATVGAAVVASASKSGERASDATAAPAARATTSSSDGPAAPSRQAITRADPPPAAPVDRPNAAKGPPSSTSLPAADDTREGWVVQVAAVTTRAEAEGIVKQLASKGYAAFVQANGTNMFRVRVGGYKARRDADAVAAKLRKEERVSPWVTH